jgi:hypothetical protein
MAISQWIISGASKLLTKGKRKKPSYLCDFDRISHEVRPADVLLIEGNNRISRMIQSLTNSSWSHAVLNIGRLHDIDDPQSREYVHKHYQGKLSDHLVIESIIGKGTVITPITEYKNEHIRICRPTGLSHQDAQRVISHAISSLGKKYDLKHVFDLARLMLMGRFIPKRWRAKVFNFRAGKATEDICSAMIARAFSGIDFPILPLVREDKNHQLEMIHRNPRLCTPSNFDYSPYFEIIKYPIFNLQQSAAYRDLPWKQGSISNDEIGVTETSEKEK